MLSKISYSNIKGQNRTLDIQPLTVLSGPNESGKSAAIEAIRLAVTGECSLGLQPAKQKKITGGNASATAYLADGSECRWSMLAGKRTHEGTDIQLNMPVTIDDFWSLTGDGRLALLDPNRILSGTNAEMESLKERKKELKGIISAPAIPQPDAYNGPPVDEIRSKTEKLHTRIKSHNEAKAAAADINSQAEKAAALRAAFSQAENELSELHQAGERIQREATEEASQQRTSRILQSAASSGITIRSAVARTAGLIDEAGQQCGVNVTGLIQQVTQAFPDTLPDFPPGQPAQSALKEWKARCEFLEQRIKDLKRDIESASTSAAPRGTLLTDDEFVQTLQEIEELRKLQHQSEAWSHYTDATSKQGDARVKASQELEAVDKRLSECQEERDKVAIELKGAVEERANAILEGVGLPELRLEISSNKRGSVLDVKIGDIDIDALARSRRILYGICLLAATQENSQAPGPILTAECAEMDRETLDRLIKALEGRKKGNIILEHWAEPTAPCHLLTMGELQSATA